MIVNSQLVIIGLLGVIVSALVLGVYIGIVAAIAKTVYDALRKKR